jgi:hypothetical protein
MQSGGEIGKGCGVAVPLVHLQVCECWSLTQTFWYSSSEYQLARFVFLWKRQPAAM